MQCVGGVAHASWQQGHTPQAADLCVLHSSSGTLTCMRGRCGNSCLPAASLQDTHSYASVVAARSLFFVMIMVSMYILLLSGNVQAAHGAAQAARASCAAHCSERPRLSQWKEGDQQRCLHHFLYFWLLQLCCSQALCLWPSTSALAGYAYSSIQPFQHSLQSIAP